MTKFLILITPILSLLLVNFFQTAQKEPLTPPPQEEISRSTSTTTSEIIIEKKAGATAPIKTEIVAKEKPAAQNPTVAKTPPPIPLLPIEPQIKTIEFDTINEKTRTALVNILCNSKRNFLGPLSGSGVLIHGQGVILTNAHIGQYFLLPDHIDCVIRTGSPAYPRYKAKLLSLSSKWVEENAEKIIQSNPTGTGENDYALLLITETVSPEEALPATFPHLDLFLGDVTLGEYMLIGSYPAGFLGGISILKNLYAVSSVTNIQEIFTFKDTTVDLFSVGGTVVSQKGSSGGAVVNKDGLLSGLVVTATESVQTSDRDLRAISINHINRSLLEETGLGIEEIIEGDILEQQKNFEATKNSLFRDIFIKILSK